MPEGSCVIDVTTVRGTVDVSSDALIAIARVIGDTLVVSSTSRETPYLALLQTLLGGILAVLAGFGGKVFEQWITRDRRRRDLEEIVRTDIGAASVTARRIANGVRTTGELSGAALDHLEVATSAVVAGRENIALIPDPSVRMALTEWLGLAHVIRKGTQELKERMRNAGPGAEANPEYQAARGRLAKNFNLLAIEGAFIVKMLGGVVTLPADPPDLEPSVDPKAADKDEWRARHPGVRDRRLRQFVYRINR